MTTARIDEIATDIFRVSVALPASDAFDGFTFNQYLIVDERPLLFHTGPRGLFALVKAAIERVMPLRRLRYVALSHYENDECGALDEFLAAAPDALPVCSRVAAMTSIDDTAARPAKALADGETLALGRHTVQWLDTPHVPHGWECGFLFDHTTATLFCGDLFSQPGAEHPPLTEDDILEPSEKLRLESGYFAATAATRRELERLAALEPRLLACMHGAAWRGDGAALLRALADRVVPRTV